MTHDIEWRDVPVGSQVWANGRAWLVQARIDKTFTLFSPQLDAEREGTPKPWAKATVLTPDDQRYIKSWADVLPTSPDEFVQALVTVRLGGRLIGERHGDAMWKVGSFESADTIDRKAHLLFFHRLTTDVELPSDPVVYHTEHPAKVRHVHV
jgi:hypothetical protein